MNIGWHMYVESNEVMHRLTKERSDCGVDPYCSKYIGQSNSE